MAKKKGEDFYVGIKEPISLRKGVLLAVKGMVTVLQRIELITVLRKDKADAIARLKELMKDIASSTINLRNKLPKPTKAMTDELRDFVKIEKKAEEDELIQPIETEAQEAKPHALSKLESELKDIERELEKLG